MVSTAPDTIHAGPCFVFVCFLFPIASQWGSIDYHEKYLIPNFMQYSVDDHDSRFTPNHLRQKHILSFMPMKLNRVRTQELELRFSDVGASAFSSEVDGHRARIVL
jgi:hypothetical protein